MDETTVQDGAVEETTASTEGETETKEEETQEQPFTEAQQAEITKQISQATQEAEGRGYTKGSREMQGKKNGEVAREKRERKIAEDTLAGLGVDLGEDTELAKLKAEKRARATADAEEKRRQQQEAYTENLNKSLRSHLKDWDIDPEDKRIDWGEGESDFIKGRSRFDASVTKIIKEDRASADKKAEEKKKAIESKENEEANSVDTSASGGAGGKNLDDLSPQEKVRMGLKQKIKK